MFEITPVTKLTDIEVVACLAREIWQEYYVPIIGQPQVDYMVPKFQSAAAISAQIADGMEYFLIVLDGAAAGYLAVERQPSEQSLFLSKLYLTKETRGRGGGREAMGFIYSLCRQSVLSTIWLTVNKRNPAVAAYAKMGFANVGDLVTDIGNGFVMDDYRMERAVDD